MNRRGQPGSVEDLTLCEGNLLYEGEEYTRYQRETTCHYADWNRTEQKVNIPEGWRL